jgi:RNA polymerase sigma factor (sigma-70 family)
MSDKAGRGKRMDRKLRFEEVVMANLDGALSLARWLTGNVPDAEDVVQEACLRAHGALDSARGANPRAWFLAITRNAAFTWLAKNRPKSLVVTDDQRVFEAAGLEMTERSAEDSLIASADARMLHQAIAMLPLPYREVLVLREFEELSYQEISQVMNIPVGTVMSRLARARGALTQRVVLGTAGKAGMR